MIEYKVIVKADSLPGSVFKVVSENGEMAVKEVKSLLSTKYQDKVLEYQVISFDPSAEPIETFKAEGVEIGTMIHPIIIGSMDNNIFKEHWLSTGKTAPIETFINNGNSLSPLFDQK